jgi:bifunctional UDP-N-acetylglucosamine pyrophosphorylase/glucosamine-1-phosphate N-acetyltransferase
MTIPLSIVILAAGKGTRMHSDLPKVLHDLAGKSLVQHVLDSARALNPRSIQMVVGFGADKIKEKLQDQELDFVYQDQQLGTGHAVMQAIPKLKDDEQVLVLYGDVPLLQSSTLLDLVSQSQGKVGILTATVSQPNGLGRIIRDDQNNICAIVEDKDATEAQRAIKEINTGLMCIPGEALKRWLPKLQANNTQGEYYLTDIVAMADTEQMNIVSTPCIAEEAGGVNDKVQLAFAERYFQLRQATELMRAGLGLKDPNRFDLRGTLTHGRNVEIDINTIIVGKVILGDGVRIGPNCLLRDCSLGAGTVVHTNSIVTESTVAENCHIGPFARLRPGNTLAAGAHVGNYVELKNTQVGTGSKANHLSYLGDSDIGAGVNIGAGTITCNYDGINKSRTTIEDDVFIGSNASLVAPVTLGAGSTVAAGSVITHDVEKKQLALGRSKQINKNGWQRPAKKKDR